jgi:hypothetical protein
LATTLLVLDSDTIQHQLILEDNPEWAETAEPVDATSPAAEQQAGQ